MRMRMKLGYLVAIGTLFVGLTTPAGQASGSPPRFVGGSAWQGSLPSPDFNPGPCTYVALIASHSPLEIETVTVDAVTGVQGMVSITYAYTYAELDVGLGAFDVCLGASAPLTRDEDVYQLNCVEIADHPDRGIEMFASSGGTAFYVNESGVDGRTLFGRASRTTGPCGADGAISEAGEYIGDMVFH